MREGPGIAIESCAAAGERAASARVSKSSNGARHSTTRWATSQRNYREVYVCSPPSADVTDPDDVPLARCVVERARQVARTLAERAVEEIFNTFTSRTVACNLSRSSPPVDWSANTREVSHSVFNGIAIALVGVQNRQMHSSALRTALLHCQMIDYPM